LLHCNWRKWMWQDKGVVYSSSTSQFIYQPWSIGVSLRTSCLYIIDIITRFWVLSAVKTSPNWYPGSTTRGKNFREHEWTFSISVGRLACQAIWKDRSTYYVIWIQVWHTIWQNIIYVALSRRKKKKKKALSFIVHPFAYKIFLSFLFPISKLNIKKNIIFPTVAICKILLPSTE
jgi:hypothetical protein